MITVYTQPNCRPCKRVIDQFKAAGIDHEVIDLLENALAADFVLRALKGKSTPVIHDDVTGDIIRGYQPDLVKKLIERITSGS